MHALAAAVRQSLQQLDAEARLEHVQQQWAALQCLPHACSSPQQVGKCSHLACCLWAVT